MRTLLLALALLVLPAAARAQTGACPTGAAVAIVSTGWVCVTPNSDYNSTFNPGTGDVPVVVRIDLLLFGPNVASTASDPATQTIPLGKPTPNAQGALWVQVPAILTIPTGQVWHARAVAVGQPLAGGAAQVSGRSPESNPFLRPAPVPAPLAPLGTSVPI